MRGPLAVTVVDNGTPHHVTSATEELRFTKAASGGFHSASMRLRLPRGFFRDLGPADRVVVTDARTGRTVWEGFTENPGVVDGPGGQEYDLSAIGTTTLASDQSRALIYIDRDLGRWEEVKYAASALSATAQTADDPTAPESTATPTPGLLAQVNPGQPVGTGKVAAIRYLAIEEAGMALGAIAGTVRGGKVDAGYVPDWTTRTPTGSGSSSNIVATLDTAPTSFSGTVGSTLSTTGFPEGRTRAELRLKRTGVPTNVADDDTWAFFYDVAISARRMNRYGTLLSGTDLGHTQRLIRAHHVVEDLLGRVLTFVDKAAARVDFGGTADIDQLAYPDGITAQALLDDLALWEPDHLWEVLEHTDNGYRFNYRVWPTAPRYEISATRDDFNAIGGDVDLCNRIAVYWADAKGDRRTTIVTTTVPALDAVGRTRDADPVELSEGLGSTANAQRIGEQTLAAKNTPPKSGTATVARWILDRDTGRMVGPWEIEAGHLVRVRETGDDLRLTEVEYDDANCAATLTLGTPVLSEEQRIARLSQRRRTA